MSLPNEKRSFIKGRIITSQPEMFRFLRRPAVLKPILRTIGLIIWLIYPYICLRAAEYVNFFEFTSANFAYKSVFDGKTLIMIFDLIIMYLISVITALLFKRLSVSCIILGGLSFFSAFASYLKFQSRGEFLYPWDFLQAKNIGTLTEYINTVIPKEFIYVFALLALLAGIVLISRASVPVGWIVRVPAALIVTLTVFLTYSQPSNAHELLTSFGMSFMDAALQESNYVANGFVGGFTLNALSSSVSAPDGYSESAVSAITDRYTSSEASDSFSSPDIILILQESFWDVTQLPGCTFSSDPLENFRRISELDNAYSGKFFTNAYGGGTVRPEFEVLTGLTTDYLPSGSVPYQYVTDNVDGYPSFFKSLGYETTALHPYLSTFYMRSSKYPLLGFDNIYFSDELQEIDSVECTIRGGQISDHSFVNYIEHFLENGDAPQFIFGISMESHQPYPNKFTEDELDIHVECDALDDELLNIVNQYTQCVADADRSIAELVEYIDSRDRDTILIVYGDHTPTLGANFAAYNATGYLPSDRAYTEEEYEKLYSTPFLVYSNFDTEESEIITSDPDNKVASYNLMNGVTELIGSPRTSFMEFLSEFHDIAPGYNVRVGDDTDEALKLAEEHKMLTYDRIFGKKYSGD